MTGEQSATPHYDLRLVPAALTTWAVTAAGTLWPVGHTIACCCLVLAAGSAWVCGRAQAGERARIAASALLAASVVGAGFGLAIGLRTNSIRDHPLAEKYGTFAEVTVIPSDTPRYIGASRMLFSANLRTVGAQEMHGRVVVIASANSMGDLAAGQPVRVQAKIGRPTRRDLTVGVLTAFGEPTVGQASGVQRFAAAVRDRFAAQARAVLPSAEAAMVPALVLGDTSAIGTATAAEFRAAGLTHLTAVSGANVTIVCGAVLFLGRVVGPRAAVGLAASALIAFVIVVQPTPSVLRAAVMGAITLLAILTARRRQALPALATAVIALMTVAPHLAVDVGFALSVSATAALVVLAPAWSTRLSERGWPRPLADALCIALAAQLVTAPLVAGISGTLSLVAVLANLIVAVVIAPITVLGTAAAALGPMWPGAGRLLIRFTGPEVWWLLHVAHWAAGVPNATVPVPSGPGGVLVLGFATIAGVAAWRVRWFRFVAGCSVACLGAWSMAGWIHGHRGNVGGL